ncbi:MAG: alcohol dehydrogenase catalytic domain-containing protein [Desulfobacteraceae bacterium]|nr:alcohol dehydrogenase catalytic domain-containing protein [Desulfobacteraceae bacterium]
MKAAVLRGPETIKTETVDYPEVPDDGIVIHVKACGVCGSDLHVYKEGKPEGTIFGHEFSGDVAQVGRNVKDIRVGERVTAAGFRPCGQCFWCGQGKFHRCANPELTGYQLPGAMAEYVSIPIAIAGQTVFKLPDELSYEDGASVEPLSISFFSVKRGKPKEGDTAAVLGLGVIGINAVQALKALGVSRVLASGRRASRLEAAKKSGADLVIDAARQDVMAAVMDATSGMGVDMVVECAGSSATFSQATEMVRGGGRVLLVGIFEQPLAWDPMAVIRKNISLVGCLGGNFPGAIDLIQSGKAATGHLITHRFSLDEAADAFRVQLRERDAVKVMIIP